MDLRPQIHSVALLEALDDDARLHSRSVGVRTRKSPAKARLSVGDAWGFHHGSGLTFNSCVFNGRFARRDYHIL